MNVAELERLVIKLNSEFDRDKVESLEYFCDMAPALARRAIAAEKLAEAARSARIILAEHEPHPLPVLGELLDALAAWEDAQ